MAGASRTVQARQVAEEYADDQREIIKKLRKICSVGQLRRKRASRPTPYRS
jgi:hypothetical protein